MRVADLDILDTEGCRHLERCADRRLACPEFSGQVGERPERPGLDESSFRATPERRRHSERRRRPAWRRQNLSAESDVEPRILAHGQRADRRVGA